MAHISEQKCPSCGAPLRFDPESGKSVCDWCGMSYEIPTEQEDAEAAEGAEGEGELTVYNCRSCGAELVTDEVSASIKCPYCGNNIVLTGKVSGGLKPDGIIPFKIDKKSLPEAVQHFYKDKQLLPRKFFSESSIEDLAGVYVPFWLYDCTLSGPITYDAYKDVAVREGDYLVTTRNHYDVQRDFSMRFKDIPVDASTKFDDALMDSLEPFDTNGIVPFRMGYLSGFLAERFDKDSDEARARADERMMHSAMEIAAMNGPSGYSVVTNRESGLVADPVDARYVLLPVYTFNVNWGGKRYDFAMNGQTGKVVGEVPTDKGRSLLKRWGAFAAIFAIAMLLITLISC
ncbi:MAG: hypothetical protein J6P98_02175 [Clostridia bacterium]|nr:hypothetical protein [Clostridia bacterium]